MKTTLKINRCDKAETVSDYEQLPWITWFMPSKSCGVYLFVRRADQPGEIGDGTVFRINGGEQSWSGKEFWEASKPWKLMFPTSVTFVGDDRPFEDSATSEQPEVTQ